MAAGRGRTCKACGLSLEGRAIRTSGPLRQTCDDACRQAYKRGARAPRAGVVDSAAIEALSRVRKPVREPREATETEAPS